MEVAPGIHTVDSLATGRAYVVREADRVTLVDTGLKGSGDRVLRVVESAGASLTEVRQIVITHHHSDHVGSLADLSERTRATVMVHALDAPVVRGERPPPGPASGGFLKPLLRRINRPPAPARVDRELADGDEIDCLDGMQVIHTPGHTPGSVSFYCARRRLLFCGDAAANTFGLRPPIGWFTEDAARARESIRRLAALDFDVALFGHGPPLRGEAMLRFRRLVEKFA